MDEDLLGDIVNNGLQSINRLSDATDAFAKTAVGQNQRILESLIPVRQELEKQLTTLQSLNGKTDAGKSLYSSLKTDVPEVTKTFVSFQDALRRNNELLDGNAKTIDQLRDRFRQLQQQNEGLDSSNKKQADQLRRNANEMRQITRTVDQLGSATEKAKQKVDAVEGSYRHLAETTAKFKQQLKELPGAFDLATGKINNHNKAAVELEKRVLAGSKALKAMDSQMGDNWRKVGSYTESLTSFTGQLIGVTSGVGAAMLAFEGIKKALEITATMERLDAGLRAVSRDNDDFLHSQQFLQDEADTLGLKYESLIKTYKLLKAATKDTSLEGAETDHIFHALTNSGARLQLSAEEVEGALYALSQMISKGHISAEELRQQLGERLPGAMKIMADATGVSQRELDKMMQKGELLAVDVLPKFATQLDKIYGGDAQGKIMTMTAGWNRMTNQAQQFIASFNENKAVTTFFGTISSGIADTLKDLTTLVKSNAWGAFLAAFTTGNYSLIGTAASAIRAQKSKVDKEASDFRALPKDQRDLKVRAQQIGANMAQQQLQIAQSLPKTEENLQKVEDLQEEFNRQLTKANQLYNLNVKQSQEEARLIKVKAKEQADADAAKQDKLDKAAKEAARLAKEQANQQVGVVQGDTQTALAALDLKHQNGLIADEQYYKKRLDITVDGLNKERAILDKYGQDDTKKFKQLQAKKLEAQEQYNSDILKLNLGQAKKRSDTNVSKLQSLNEQGEITDADFVEFRHGAELKGISERQRLLESANRKESQEYKDLLQEKADSDAKYYKDRLKVAETEWAREYQALKDSLATTDELIDSNLKERLSKIEQEYQQSEAAIKKLQIRGSISDEEAERRLHELRLQHIQDVSRATLSANETEISTVESAYNARIAQLQLIANDESKTAEERKQAEKEIGKIRIDLEKRLATLRKTGVDVTTEAEKEKGKEDADREVKVEENKAQKKARIVEAGFQLTQMIGDAIYQADQQRLDQQLRDLEKQKDYELSLVGDNEAAKAAVEKKYDDQRKVLQHQQDVQNRQKAVFDILINTAVNVVKLLSNPLAAGIATALGLAQLAIVQSAKFPEYAEGKNVDLIDRYVGPAIAGEAGRELHFSEDGQVRMYNQRTRINVGANDVILPNRTTEALLNDSRAFEATHLLHMQQKSRALIAETLHNQSVEKQRQQSGNNFNAGIVKDAILEAYDGIPKQIWSVENGELTSTLEKGNTRIKGMRSSHQLKYK